MSNTPIKNTYEPDDNFKRCPECRGSGKLKDGSRCHLCGGGGSIPRNNSVEG